MSEILDRPLIGDLYQHNTLNKPLSYDYHGEIPLEVPFKEINANDITLYFNMDTRVGKETCQQTCSHCFFISEKEVRNKYIDLKEAAKITNSLKEKGYSVFPRTADSFTNNGEFLRIFSNSNVRNYCSGESKGLTEIMEKGEIWTSGAPLFNDNWLDLLNIGKENGFETITLTFHGIIDNNLNIKSKELYPFKNVFFGEEAEKVVARIREFNLQNAEEFSYEVAFGITIGKHNNSKQDLINYVDYFNELGVSKLRFNCYHDYSRSNKYLELSSEEIKEFYKNIKWIHQNIKLNYELGLSEDFGDSGIEVLDFPKSVGICQAGRQLFAISPEKPMFIEKRENIIIEKVGTLAGCVDGFKPVMGQLLCFTDTINEIKNYDVEFFNDVIDEVSQKRISKHYKNGCFGSEIHKEIWEMKNN